MNFIKFTDELKNKENNILVDVIQSGYKILHESYISNTEDISRQLYNELSEEVDENNISLEGEYLEYIEFYGEITDNIQSIIDNYDWYVAYNYSNKVKLKPIISSDVCSKSFKSSDVFYHATSESNVESILNNGLVSSSLNNRDKYPNRIYFTSNLSSAKQMAIELKRHHGKPMAIVAFKFNEINGVIYNDDNSLSRDSYYAQDININNVYLIK